MQTLKLFNNSILPTLLTHPTVILSASEGLYDLSLRWRSERYCRVVIEQSLRFVKPLGLSVQAMFGDKIDFMSSLADKLKSLGVAGSCFSLRARRNCQPHD